MDGLDRFLELASPVEVAGRAGWGGLVTVACLGLVAIGAAVIAVAPSGRRAGYLALALLAGAGLLTYQQRADIGATMTPLEGLLRQALPALRQLPFL